MAKSTTRRKAAPRADAQSPAKPRRSKQDRWERLCNDREKALYKHLVSKSAGREATCQALTSLLIELSNVTMLTWWDPKILKVFYRRACQIADEADGSQRREIFTVLGDIGKVLDCDLSDATLEYVDERARFPRPGEEVTTNLIALDADDEPANPELETLRGKLQRLERVPENEATRFQIESELYKLENQTDEWPDVIAA